MLDNNYQYFGHTLDFAYSPRFLISRAHRYWFFYHLLILIMNDISSIPFLCSCFVVSHQKRSSTFCRWTHNPQFSYSIWRRANARKISFETLNGGQLTLSPQLIAPNYLVMFSHRCNTTVSLETYLHHTVWLLVNVFNKQLWCMCKKLITNYLFQCII